MQTVAVLAFPGVVGFDLAIPCHAFDLAGYEVRVCGPAHRVDGGAFDIVARHPLAAAADADTVVVPGLQDEGAVPPSVVRVLRAAQGRKVSICTGAFALAAAGLLEGRRATTHWRHADQLQRFHPGVRVEPDVLFVDEGDVLTSAGVAAGLDLCLHIIGKDLGAAAANRVARRMVVAPQRSGGQAQFVDRPAATGDGGLAATRAWLLERLDEPLTVSEMARHAGYSPRTFARRFRAETGTTPLAWLLAERVRAARRALEESDAPVEHVAQQCGFGTSAGFREHFRRALRTTPSAYRAAFRASSTSVRVANPEPPLAV